LVNFYYIESRKHTAIEKRQYPVFDSKNEGKAPRCLQTGHLGALEDFSNTRYIKAS
jgi:hypothetical protein